MAKAVHICVQRLGYTHHGIDLGDGTAVHYTGEVGRKVGAAIRRTAVAVWCKTGRPASEQVRDAASPAVVAVGIGYGAYRVWRWAVS